MTSKRGGGPRALDRASGQPLWIQPASLLDADFSHTGLYQEYRARCQVTVTGGQENIRAVMPGHAEQQVLGIGADVAAFSIERLGCSHGRPAEWRHTLVRGDRFGVTAQFSTRHGYQFELSAPHRHEGHQR